MSHLTSAVPCMCTPPPPPPHRPHVAGDPNNRQAVANFRARLQAARNRIDKARANWETDCKRRQKLREARARATESVEERVARERREAEESLMS